MRKNKHLKIAYFWQCITGDDAFRRQKNMARTKQKACDSLIVGILLELYIALMAERLKNKKVFFQTSFWKIERSQNSLNDWPNLELLEKFEAS